MRNESCTPLWREADFAAQRYKTPGSRSALKCAPLWREAHFEGPLLEVEMSKKCTPLRREAHFEVKMYKAPQCRTAFES